MSNTNTRNVRLVILSLSLLWLIIVGLNFSHLSDLKDPEFYFPQGDNLYTIYNIEADVYHNIAEYKNSFFFGTTYFQCNNTSYIGIIEQLEVDSGFQINFKYSDIEKPSKLSYTKIADIDLSIDQSVNIKGLSTRIENQSLIFSTIWREGDSVFSQINYIYEFELSGNMIQNTPIISSYADTTPHDIESLSNGSYIMIFSLERGEATTSEGKYLAVVPGNGILTRLIALDETIRSVAFDEKSNNYLTISTDSNKLKTRDSMGNTIIATTLNRQYSEIDLIENNEILLKYYVNPINKFISRSVISIILILIPISIVIFYWKYKNYKFVQYDII